MLEGMLDLTVFGVTGGEVRLAMVMVVDGGGKGRRGGDEGEGAVGGRQKVDMVDMHGYGNAVGRRISCVCVCVCVYTLSPLRISTPISPTPIPGVGSSRRCIRVHGPRLKHLYNYCWRDTIDGKRLYSLSVDVSVNTVMAGQGERPSGSNQLPAWAVCLLFTTTSWYSWT